MFEDFPADGAGRRALPPVRAAGGFGQVGAGGQAAVPVLGPLAGLLPGGLRRGDAVAVRSRDHACDYLTLALLAGALGAGLWCAVVGVPELGGVALSELLADRPDPHGGSGLDRLLLVPEPGERWAQVAVALADGVDLVLVRPSGPVDAAVGRRVDARLRQGRGTDARHSAALLVLGSWPSARVVVQTERVEWVGLDGAGLWVGTGQLRGGLATVVARGRAAGGRARSVQLWLPSADGSARAVGDGIGAAAYVESGRTREIGDSIGAVAHAVAAGAGLAGGGTGVAAYAGAVGASGLAAGDAGAAAYVEDSSETTPAAEATVSPGFKPQPSDEKDHRLTAVA